MTSRENQEFSRDETLDLPARSLVYMWYVQKWPDFPRDTFLSALDARLRRYYTDLTTNRAKHSNLLVAEFKTVFN